MVAFVALRQTLPAKLAVFSRSPPREDGRSEESKILNADCRRHFPAATIRADDFTGTRLSGIHRLRRDADQGGPKNDALAPEPGFTVAQYDRLALLYVSASVPHGAWLIPG